LEVEVGEPRVNGVGDGNDEGVGEWRGEEDWGLVAFLDDDGEEIEGGRGRRGDPAEVDGLGGEGGIFGVAEGWGWRMGMGRGMRMGFGVTCVGEELMIPDAHGGALGAGGGEDGDEGLDFALVDAEVEVFEEGGVDEVGIGEVSEVADAESRPEEATDAAGVIAPG